MTVQVLAYTLKFPESVARAFHQYVAFSWSADSAVYTDVAIPAEETLTEKFEYEEY